MADGTLAEQIQRSLAALEKYGEMWIMDMRESSLNELRPEDYMLYRERDGRSPWLEQLQIRSTLMLALAVERQNESNKPSYEPVKSRFIFEQALDEAEEQDTVSDLVRRFSAEHGVDLTIEFCQWLEPKLTGRLKNDIPS